MKKLMGTVQIGSPVGTMKVTKPHHTAEAPYGTSVHGETASGNPFDLPTSPSGSFSAASSPGFVVPVSLVPEHLGDDRDLLLASGCDIQGLRHHSMAMCSGCDSSGRISPASEPSAKAQEGISRDKKPRSCNAGDGRQHSRDKRLSGRYHGQLLQRRCWQGDFWYQPSGSDGDHWGWEREHHSRRQNRPSEANWPWTTPDEANRLVYRAHRKPGDHAAKRRLVVGRLYRFCRFGLWDATGERGTGQNTRSTGFSDAFRPCSVWDFVWPSRSELFRRPFSCVVVLASRRSVEADERRARRGISSRMFSLEVSGKHRSSCQKVWTRTEVLLFHGPDHEGYHHSSCCCPPMANGASFLESETRTRLEADSGPFRAKGHGSNIPWYRCLPGIGRHRQRIRRCDGRNLSGFASKSSSHNSRNSRWKRFFMGSVA